MNITAFTVLPDTPPALKALTEIAYNMWFSWNSEARALFRKLDPQTWLQAGKNPVRMLCLISPERLEEAATDTQYLHELEQVYERFKAYLAEKTWYERQYGKAAKGTIAYFSCEYGMHESLPVYSGGLGVLSGDHIKSASDLGLPLVGIGLLYRQGYFRQYLNADGTQQELYPENDWYSMPVHLEKQADGTPLLVSVLMDGHQVSFQIWRVDVGRTAIYLLDTNLDTNAPSDRNITTRLYDPDRDVRIRQEILLGIGGVKALEALGLKPQVFHVNEGHSAFLLLERIRQLMHDQGLSFDEAREVVWATTIFTTHTPVPAGNERFHRDLLYRYLNNYIQQLGIPWDQFLHLGLENAHNPHEEFCMTILALRLSAHANGVAKLHGVVSRKMWRSLYRDIPETEVPIGAVTNGVHSSTWLSSQLRNLFQRYLGPSVFSAQADFSMWGNVENIPDAELWATHEANRRRLLSFTRERLRSQMERRGVSVGELNRVDEILNPNALTIGFARRFATYKRGYLIFKNPERLAKILLNPERPVQLIFAGKAHPADHAGKDIIRHIFDFARRPELRKSIVFLEDYDVNVARYLVQGVDVWLNNPRRPEEASGTSGMKAAMNGALNLSILDGWWDEAYNHDVGWAIGRGEQYDHHDVQDAIEGDLLYAVLEQDVVPIFYQRNAQGLPTSWIRRMKTSVRTLGAQFNSHRMLSDYTTGYYQPALALGATLAGKKYAPAKELAAWRQKLAGDLGKVEVARIESPIKDLILKGKQLEVTAWVKLNGLAAEDVVVEVFHGPLNSRNDILDPRAVGMTIVGKKDDLTQYRAVIPCSRGGHYGYTVRLLPGHKHLATRFVPGLVKWA